MFRKILICGCLAAAVALLGGCDFLRRAAGRPTSDEIQAKREKIALDEARHKARMDSLALVEKQAADSLALLDSIRRSGGIMLGADRLGGLTASNLPWRYYVIAGSFALPENAARLVDKAEKAGVKAYKIRCTTGYTAVGILPTNTLAGVAASLQQARSLDFCPKDIWVLVNE